MKHSYWVSYQFKTRGGIQGFGALDIFTVDHTLSLDSMPSVRSEIQRSADLPGASIVIIAISKFES